MKVAIVLACFLAVASSETFAKWKDCGSGNSAGTITNLDVDPPCEAKQCRLKRGEDAALAVTFTAPYSSTKLRARVDAILGGIEVPFPLPNTNGCTSVGCPIVAGQSYTYSDKLEIEDNYPLISLSVKWRLFDEDNGEVWCMVVPVSVYE